MANMVGVAFAHEHLKIQTMKRLIIQQVALEGISFLQWV